MWVFTNQKINDRDLKIKKLGMVTCNIPFFLSDEIKNKKEFSNKNNKKNCVDRHTLFEKKKTVLKRSHHQEK